MSDDECLSYSIDENVSFEQLSEKEMLELYAHLYGSDEQGSASYHEQKALWQSAIEVGVSCSSH
jgi:hypothetical protein